MVYTLCPHPSTPAMPVSRAPLPQPASSLAPKALWLHLIALPSLSSPRQRFEPRHLFCFAGLPAASLLRHSNQQWQPGGPTSQGAVHWLEWCMPVCHCAIGAYQQLVGIPLHTFLFTPRLQPIPHRCSLAAHWASLCRALTLARARLSRQCYCWISHFSSLHLGTQWSPLQL